MNLLNKHSGTATTIGIFLLGLAFSTGILWNEMRNLRRGFTTMQTDVKAQNERLFQLETMVRITYENLQRKHTQSKGEKRVR